MNDLFWLTMVLLVVAALLRSELFFYMLYVVVGLQVAARLWLRRSVRQITWRRRAQATLFPGEAATVELEVHNDSLLPLPWLAIHESIPMPLRAPGGVRHVISLGAGERRVLEYSIQASKRGYYQLGPLTLKTGDVLGLGERTLETQEQAGLTVYPLVLPLGALGLPAALPFGVLAARRSLFSDPARPAGVRAYQPGDDTRRIDWKSSARASGGVLYAGASGNAAASGNAGWPTMLVRRHEPAIALDTLIALAFGLNEYGRFAYDEMERALVAAASLAAHLSGQRQPVGLCTSGRDPLTGAENVLLPMAHGRAHLLELLGVLGRLEPTSSGNLPALLWEAGGRLGWGSTLVVITSGSQELIGTLLPLRRRGFNLALIMPDATPELLGLAKQHGITAYAVARDGRPG